MIPSPVIPHSRPWIVDADRQSVMAVLDSGMVAYGEMVEKLERKVASYLDVPFAFACSSGTSALVLALKAIGVRQKQEVIMPTYVCRNVMDAVQAVGCIPVFCDVGSEWTATAENVAPLVNERTGAIIAVHIFGLPMEIEPIRKFKIPVIEDACQAFGATLYGKKLGTLGDIGVLSFHATKCLTTGEGGMVVFSSPELASRVRFLRNTCVMSSLNAVLGVSQIARYDEFIKIRRSLSMEYRRFFYDAKFPDLLQPPEKEFYFRYVLRTKKDPCELIDAFKRRNIMVRRGVDALLHRISGLDDSIFPNAVRLYNSTISLPFYPSLKKKFQKRILKACHEILGGECCEH